MQRYSHQRTPVYTTAVYSSSTLYVRARYPLKTLRTTRASCDAAATTPPFSNTRETFNIQITVEPRLTFGLHAHLARTDCLSRRERERERA